MVDNYRNRGPDVWYTCNSYDITVSEPRIAIYVGIARGQIPPEDYFATCRTFPATCDWSLAGAAAGRRDPHVRRASRSSRARSRYRGIQFVPSWGGDMFEALMPDLFVPEATWGPRSWAVNHPLTVRAQIEHGLAEAGYGYWGFSPASDPFGGYTAWGVDAIGMDPDGYPSDEESTNVDAGFGDCRAGHQPDADVRRRGGDAARGLPGPAVRARRGAGQPGQAQGELRRSTAPAASTTRSR